MKCPVCEREGEKSCVYQDGGMSTCVYSAPYWDEEGRFHQHDPNTHTEHYRCSHGHNFMVQSRSGCPACGTEGWENITELPDAPEPTYDVSTGRYTLTGSASSPGNAGYATSGTAIQSRDER